MLGELVELVACHPMRDSLRGLLMLTYYRAGRQHDALEVYEAGRRLLAEEFGLDPGPELRALHERVLRGDRSLLATPAPRTRRVEVTTRPSLPRAPKVFVGRAREVELVVSEVCRPAAGGSVVLGIDGMGGVGKTSLVLHAAHRLSGAYPDGQYFVDLHGFSRQRKPLAAGDVLDLLLRTAGIPPEQIHPGLDGRVAQWRGHLTNRRVLVMLDNVSDEAQVRPLMPGLSEPAVLITSRRRLVGVEELVPISLDVLPVDDAVLLLRRMSGRWDADADAEAVARSCGSLPLALRVVASRLRHHPGWSMAYLAVATRDRRRLRQLLTTGDRDVFGDLALSYERLTDRQRRFFRTLASHPRAGFGSHAAAAAAGLSLVEVEQLLDELVEANLVLPRQEREFRVPGLLCDLACDLSRRDGSDDRPEGSLLPA